MDRKSLYRGAHPNQASPKCSDPVKRNSPSPGFTWHCRSVWMCPRQGGPGRVEPEAAACCWKTPLRCQYTLTADTSTSDVWRPESWETFLMEPRTTDRTKSRTMSTHCTRRNILVLQLGQVELSILCWFNVLWWFYEVISSFVCQICGGTSQCSSGKNLVK